MSDERKPMTDEELAAIHGRLDAITPHPWFHVLASIVGTKDDPEAPDATCVCCTEWGYCGDDPQANAEFIAAAPDDIARLLAEVEQLRKEHAWLLQEVAKTNRTPVYCPMPDRYECLYHVGDECRSKEDEMRVGCWRTAVECAVKCGEKRNAE